MNRVLLSDEGEDKANFVAIALTDQKRVRHKVDDAAASETGFGKLVTCCVPTEKIRKRLKPCGCSTQEPTVMRCQCACGNSWASQHCNQQGTCTGLELQVKCLSEFSLEE